MSDQNILVNVITTLIDRKVIFCTTIMLIIWLLSVIPSQFQLYSIFHMLPETVVIFLLGQNVRKFGFTDFKDKMFVPIVVLSAMVSYVLLVNFSVTSCIVTFIFCIMFLGGYLT